MTTAIRQLNPIRNATLLLAACLITQGLGCAHFMKKRSASGDASIDRSGDAMVYVQEGRRLAKGGDEEGALRCFRIAADLDPENVEARCRAAEMLIRDRETLAEAKALLDAAAASEPVDEKAWIDIGNVYFRAAAWESARTAYSQAVIRNPESPDALYNLGLIDLKNGDGNSAAYCFDRYITLRPKDANAHYYRARALILKGNTVTATDALTRCLDLDPHHAHARATLTRLSLVSSAK